MTPPPDGRYSLRFESGERAGEVVAISRSGMVLGRRPGTSLQLVEPSVSGRHAELSIDADGVTIRDLGSTNGTRIGKERIEEGRLAHGDAVSVGNVRFTFLDAGLDAAAPEIRLEGAENDFAADPHADTLDASSAGEALQHVSADRVARSGRRSIIPLLLLLLLPAGGVAAWWFLGRSSGTSTDADEQVAQVEGNLLEAGYSFEADGDEGAEASAWTTDENALAAFTTSRGARRSGALGLTVELAAGEWSRAASQDVRAPLDGELELRGYVRLEGNARARLGVRFTASGGGPSPVEALSAPLGQTDGFEEVVVRVAVPPGYDRARAVALGVAGSDGDGASFDVDDVALIASGAGAPTAEFEENSLHLLGDPAFVATLFEIDTVVLSGIAAIDSHAAQLGGVTPLTAAADPVGMRVTLGTQGGADRLVLRAEPAALTGGLATTAEGGYRTHAAEFQRDAVTSLLVGAGRDLVRLAFAQPARVVGRPADQGFRIEVALRPGDAFTIQLGFREERATAAGIAARARTAAKEGRRGECLALWSELLDRYPFERSLVEEAERERSRLIQEGMQELQVLDAELERARFFRLADLFREVRGHVQALVRSFEGSEVASAGAERVTAIEAELDALDGDRGELERERLGSILTTLRAEEMTGLAGAVEDYLARLGGSADADAPEGNR